MQSISQVGFTDAQILDRLKSGEGRIGPLYQVVDIAGNVLETLGTGDAGVIRGSISMNADNEIKSQISMEMRPVASLTGLVAFQRWIRAIYQLEMPNGQIVSWRMGDFLWINPNRSFWRDDELWEVVLGDRTQLCDYASVPTNGFTAPQSSSNYASLINQLLGLAGLPQNFSGGNGDTPQTKTWSSTMPRKIANWESQVRMHQRRGTSYGQRRAKDIQKKIDQANLTLAPTTLLAIMNELSAFTGVPRTDVMFSSTNIAQLGYCAPQNILNIGPLFTFDTSWLQSPVETSIYNDTICNRFVVTSSGSPTLVDANTAYPQHPMRQAVIGRYIDNSAPYPGQISQTSFGQRALRKLMSDYERVSFDAFIHPGVQPYDIVSLHVPGSSEYATPRNLYVRQIEFDLDTGVMGLQGLRIYV